jgi:hypothetical protein
LDRVVVELPSLAVSVGPEGTSNVGALVPIQTKPSQALEDRVDELGLRGFRICVLDPEDEGASFMACE